MRAKRTSQMSIFDQFAAHDIGLELKGCLSNLMRIPSGSITSPMTSAHRRLPAVVG